MSSRILDSLGGLLTPALLSRASSELGESEAAVAKALRAAFPALLSGILDKSADGAAMRRVFDLIRGAGSDAGALRDPAALLGPQRPGTANLGARLLATLFGARTTDRIAEALARHAGIRSSAAGALLGIAAPLLLSGLGERASREGLGLEELLALLSGERDSLRSAVPAELATVLREARPPSPALREGRASASPGWLWPAVIGLAVLVGLWWLIGRGQPDARGPLASPPPAETPPVAAAPPGARLVTRDLPGGTRLEIPEDGLESRLVAHLEAGRGAEDVWFELDRIQFESGSASLRPGSRAQLRDVAAILKAYPAVKLEIGGYTDDTGDPAANQQLSQARAESVRGALVAEGVAADRLEAEGYGERHPIASNDTMEGRARNRRIALRVTGD